MHILVNRCREPGIVGPDPWICGIRAHENEALPSYVQAGLCSDDVVSNVYASLSDREDMQVFKFPPGTGVMMGGDTGYKYFVISTHYPDVSNLTDGWTQPSEVKIRIIPERSGDLSPPMRNVVYRSFILAGSLPPHSESCVTGFYPVEKGSHSLIGVGPHSHDMSVRYQLWLWHKDGDKQIIVDSNQTSAIEGTVRLVNVLPLRDGDRFLLRCSYSNPLDETIVVQ